MIYDVLYQGKGYINLLNMRHLAINIILLLHHY